MTNPLAVTAKPIVIEYRAPIRAGARRWEADVVRVLFTCIGGPGHLNPLLPISQAMTDVGHTVLWATSESLGGCIRHAGFAFHQLGSPTAVKRREREPLRTVDAERSDQEVRENFADRATRSRLPHVWSLMRDWQPGVVVCDEFDFATMLAAEQVGVPHASVLVTAAGLQIRPDVVGEPLRKIRTEWGLPTDPDLRMLGRYLRLSPFPPTFRAPDARRYGTERVIRPPMPEQAGPLPNWASVRAGAPRVYFTLGTEFGMESGDLFERVLAGLRELPINLLMTVGRHIDPAEFGPQPKHVRIAQYMPQHEILPHCDVAISHGGSGSVTGALAHGVPMALLPLGVDQPTNAKRCTKLDAAVELDAVAATPADVRASNA